MQDQPPNNEFQDAAGVAGGNLRSGHAGGARAAGVAGGGSVRPIPPKLYRIGELVEYAGISRQTVHNYATMGLLRESKWTKGGHRLFDETAFERLATIAQLKARRKSMHYIREYFARLEGGRPERGGESVGQS
ncbi:MAG: helix-turn-helix domain-containing protein [Planctomycetota bacterium]|jgi:hypothetical protein